MNLILALLAFVSAGAPSAAAPPTAAPTRMIVAGPPAGIAKMEKAARKCGLIDIERQSRPGGEDWLVIRGVPADIPDDHPVMCAMVWVSEHPKLDLYFLGSAPAE